MRIAPALRSLAVILTVWTVIPSVVHGATRVVPTDFPTIQGAINASRSGDVVIVAPGTYHENIVIADKRLFLRGTNSRSQTVVAATIIDLTGRTGPAIEIRGTAAQNTTVSGLTVRDSSAEGILVHGTAATVEYCQVRQNKLTGIHSSGGCVADNTVLGNEGDGISVSNCEVKDNTISGNGGCGIKTTLDTFISGNVLTGNTGSGVMALGTGSHRIGGNMITGNGDGGIVCETNGDISGNIVLDNTAESSAGVRLTGSGPFTVTRNLIACNSASISGGGLSLGLSNVELISNTIAANTAPVGAGVQLTVRNGNLPKIRNCIIALNRVGGGLVGAADPTPALAYNDVFGNEGGNYVGLADSTGANGNISVDPLFADPNSGDFRLKSRGGRFNGITWVLDAVSSPCLDAGDPAAAYGLEPLPNGGRLNMGYDGNTSTASKSGCVTIPSALKFGPRGTGCSVTTNLTVRFSTPMKQGSVQNNLYINGLKVTSGTFTWLGSKMTYNPAVNFKPGRRYQVRIARAALSRAGVKMAADVVWNFTTAAAPAGATLTAMPTASGAQLAVQLSAAADVTVSICNLSGREIAVVAPGELQAGVHSLLWNGRSHRGTKVPAGSYLCQLTAKNADGSTCQAVSLLALE